MLTLLAIFWKFNITDAGTGTALVFKLFLTYAYHMVPVPDIVASTLINDIC
jgi:hypothetical protein